MKLQIILKDLYQQAYQHPNKTFSHQLPNGLKISLRWNMNKSLTLAISRPDVFPSESEWNTIFAHWNYPRPITLAPEYEKVAGPNNYLGATFFLKTVQLEDMIDELEKI